MAYHYIADFTLPDSPELGFDATRRAWLSDAREALANMVSNIPTQVLWERGDLDSDEVLLIEFDGRYGDTRKRQYLDRIEHKLVYFIERVDELPAEITLSHRREA